MVGTVQILLVVAVADTVGGNSGYQVITSQWVVGKKLRKLFPFMAKFRCGLGHWWQVIFFQHYQS